MGRLNRPLYCSLNKKNLYIPYVLPTYSNHKQLQLILFGLRKLISDLAFDDLAQGKIFSR